MTRRRGTTAADDPGARALVAAGTPVVTLVGKTSAAQVERVMNVSLDENVAMIDDTVRYLKSAGRRVVYDAEHFFDAFRADRAYALRTLAAAEAAGADVLCPVRHERRHDARAGRGGRPRRARRHQRDRRHPHAQ
jgi:2-isopropylmalate synthase